MADLDPDALALLYVQQYLSEKGYHAALSALEQTTGIKYDDDKPARGSELMELVYQRLERQLAASGTDSDDDTPEASAAAAAAASTSGITSTTTNPSTGTSTRGTSCSSKRQKQQAFLTEELMLRSAAADYPRHISQSLCPAGSANLLSLQLWPGEDLLAAGSADGTIKLLGFGQHSVQQNPAGDPISKTAAPAGGGGGDSSSSESEGPVVLWSTQLSGAGGVLVLTWHPAIHQGKISWAASHSHPNSLLLAGCMDGSLHLLHAASGQLLASAKPHSKYVVAASWAPCHLNPTHLQQQQQHRQQGCQQEQQEQVSQQQQQQQQVEEGEQLLATASYDSSCCLLRLVRRERASNGGSDQALGLEEVQKVPFPSYVQDVCFLPLGLVGLPPEMSTTGRYSSKSSSSSSYQAPTKQQLQQHQPQPTQSDSLQLLVAVRGTNCLQLLQVKLLPRAASNTVGPGASSTSSSSNSSSLGHCSIGDSGLGGSDDQTSSNTISSGDGSSSSRSTSRQTWGVSVLGVINMSEAQDSHVSFSAMRLALSPCNRYVLVASDSPILLVLRLSDWGVVRRLYGLEVDKFHNASVAWHRSSSYVFAGASHAAVYVYHVGSAKVVEKLGGHTVNVRAIDYDTTTNRLATCSFDKSVKVYEAT